MTIAWAGPPPVGAWTYVVAVYDGAKLVIYIDGAAIAAAADTRSQASKTAHELLACKSFNYVSIQGAADEFAIYDDALTSAKIQAHWAASGR